jgi:hypothetical protein
VRFNLAALPIAIVIVLLAWDTMMIIQYASPGAFSSHLAVYVFATFVGALAILWHDMEGDAGRYIESLIQPNRSALIGISAFLMGGMHFLTFARTVPVYLLMGYMLALLAYCETASISTDFRDHFTSGRNKVSRDTVLSLLANRLLILGMAFLLSAMGLYLALMGVVGFRTVWSILFFTCILFLILVVLVKMRKL